MKKILIMFLLGVTTVSVAQEKFDTNAILTNAGSPTWQIQSVADDTSKIFPLYYYQSIQYCFEDTATGGVNNDSLLFSIKLLTSNLTVDTTFALAQTLVASCAIHGWQPIVAFNSPPARFGKIVVTGLLGNSKKYPLYGKIIICGWSNQPSIDNILR